MPTPIRLDEKNCRLALKAAPRIYSRDMETEHPHFTLHEHELGRILEVARRMGSERDLDPLLKLILDESCVLLRAERASLFLHDAKTHEIYSKIALKSEIGEIRIPVGVGIAGAVARDLVCITIPDAYQDPRFNQETDRKTGWRTRSILACPMLDLEGQLVGVLQVLNKKDGPFTAYDEYVISVLGAQAGVALDRARLQQEYRAKVVMEQELDIARRIQQALLPAVTPCLRGFDLAGWSQPCAETGGDIYDLFTIREGLLGFLLGDATGHGIGPALMISETRAAVRALAATTQDLNRILAGANDLLVQDAPDGRFVTIFAGLIDGASQTVHYSSAGQGPSFLLADEGRRIETIGSTGLPLGVLPGQKWPQVELKMNPGDILLVISDGIIECANRANEQLGNDRFVAAVAAHRHDTAAEIVAVIAALTEEFAAGEPFRDDRTAIVLRRT